MLKKGMMLFAVDLIYLKLKKWDFKTIQYHKFIIKHKILPNAALDGLASRLEVRAAVDRTLPAVDDGFGTTSGCVWVR